MTSSYKNTTHERHNTRYTISRKHASGFTLPAFQGESFKLFISFGHGFGIIIKKKCCPFKQCIFQQPIMSIYSNITPMTELPDPPSYLTSQLQN